MKRLRIGTRDSQLAVWQATRVQELLRKDGVDSELVYLKSEGDIDTVTPLYALGVTGVFTRTLDAALLSGRIDIAVHSMKDVPVQMAQGIRQAAVLERGSHKDILVPHPGIGDISPFLGSGLLQTAEVTITSDPAADTVEKWGEAIDTGEPMPAIIATSSIRRIAQWKHRYPHHSIENLRGNVNTRLRKLKESNWQGAIFAAAGLERINLRPANAIDLDWMLPAPAQGAVLVVCGEKDEEAFKACQSFHDAGTALCTKIERDFLSGLMGGCSTPISALARIENGLVKFKGNIVSPDSYHEAEFTAEYTIEEAFDLGKKAAEKILSTGGREIIERLRNKGLANDEA